MQATVHRPGEGERIGGPTTVTVKATGEETNDSFYLGEVVIEPGFPGPPPHRHERVHDMFYVLDGTLTMRLGDDTLELEPGSFVCVHPGVVHTFSNQSDAPVRFLNFNTPAGWEKYMRDLAAVLASGTPTQEEIGRIASRYDFEVV
jgi:quercetin dioxygenase-like cupin family protein